MTEVRTAEEIRKMADDISSRSKRTPSRRPRLRAGAVIAVAAAIGFVVWLLIDQTGGKSPTAQRPTAVPISLSGLKTLSGALNRPIYWAGPRPGLQYEFTQGPGERMYVRYLPKGAKIGEQKQFLSIGTYRLSNAFAATRSVALRKGSVRIPVGRGGIAFYNSGTPTNVYLAYPGSDYQVEIFDPSAREAHRLVATGQVKPVARVKSPASGPSGNAASVSASGLKALSTRLKQPIYWVGAKTHVTYELTQAADGRIYVRYLPGGFRVGEQQKPFLTVGTYRLARAFSVTRQAAGNKGSVRLKLRGGGGVAFYSRGRPTNVYVAYPGQNYQVEVFDPSPQRAQKFVASGQVQPVR